MFVERIFLDKNGVFVVERNSLVLYAALSRPITVHRYISHHTSIIQIY